MKVHVDTGSGDDRRIVAEVESSSEWRRRRYGPYVVDLVQGGWYCTCWRSTPDRPCRHVVSVMKYLEESRGQ